MPPPAPPPALQSISIPRTESRASPSPHTVYAILVSLPVRNWTVYRRYSEFLSLHTALSPPGTDAAPPAPFPPKHAAKSTLRAITGGLTLGLAGKGGEGDEELVRERRTALERYLRAIVASPDPQWRETDAFKDFVELPRSQRATAIFGAGAGTAAGQGVGQTSQSQGQPPASSNGSAYARWKAQSGAPPGSFPSSSDTPSTHTAPFSRHLGSPSPSSRPPAEETEHTRSRSSRGLLSSQEDQFARQDAALGDLTAILRRQRQMGVAINQELMEQNEMLDGLDEEVRGVQGKLGRNEGLVRRLG